MRMINLTFKQKVIAGAIIAGIIFTTGFYFLKIYQSPAKTDSIYSQALKDYESGEYSNSYYLFSKISFFSDLKPIAIYHQAECARRLNDKNTAIKRYSFVFKHYPRHKLSLRTKYLAAQELIDSNPKLAKKHFEYILAKHPNTDYAIASEYYSGVILLNKYKNSNKLFPVSEQTDAENYFRHYLTNAPSGRHALNTVNNWLTLTKEINADDYLLMARTCYLFGENEKARSLILKSEPADTWALDVKNAYVLKDYLHARLMTEIGLAKYSKYVSDQDIYDAVDIYLKTANSRNDSLNYLLTIANKKGRDYLLNLKCSNISPDDKEACYSHLYLKYPDGNFSADALSNIFFEKIRKNDLNSAKKIGKDHLNKFMTSSSAPKVMFWMGKINERTNNYNEYTSYYKSVISKFPDNYYAYRAYLRLNHINTPIITNYIEKQPIVYPYKYTRKNIIVKLVELGDYDVISELCDDDGFIKSWVLYKKGEYTQSVVEARNAMDKLTVKPDKYDLRWRLVYPLNYYDIVKIYADKLGNNAPLMQSILREESYFDPLAQSAAGASGLMQLMPVTASEVSSKYNLGMVSTDCLFNSKLNIQLGNHYYAFLKSTLSGADISSIAAYNGGIGSLQRWKSTLYYNDSDEFIEQIPYPETQAYVKKVFRSYWNYIRIYR